LVDILKNQIDNPYIRKSAEKMQPEQILEL